MSKNISIWHVGSRGLNCVVPRTDDHSRIGYASDTWWWCNADHPERNERARVGRWAQVSREEAPLSTPLLWEWVGADGSDDGSFFAVAAWSMDLGSQLGICWDDWCAGQRWRIEQLLAHRAKAQAKAHAR